MTCGACLRDETQATYNFNALYFQKGDPQLHGPKSQAQARPGPSMSGPGPARPVRKSRRPAQARPAGRAGPGPVGQARPVQCSVLEYSDSHLPWIVVN